MSPDDLERAAEILRRTGLSTTTDPGVELLWVYDSTTWWAVAPDTSLDDVLRDATVKLGEAIRQETDADALAQAVGVVCGTLTWSDAAKSLATWQKIEKELRDLHRKLQAHAALPWYCGRPGPVELMDAAPIGDSWTPPVVQLTDRRTHDPLPRGARPIRALAPGRLGAGGRPSPALAPSTDRHSWRGEGDQVRTRRGPGGGGGPSRRQPEGARRLGRTPRARSAGVGSRSGESRPPPVDVGQRSRDPPDNAPSARPRGPRPRGGRLPALGRHPARLARRGARTGPRLRGEAGDADGIRRQIVVQ
jgi:hypothetical protein